MSKTIKITDANFDEAVLQSDLPVLVDFWATWCGPCKAIAPVLEEMATDLDGQVVIGKLDVDANPQTSQKFGVMSIPTLLVFKDGKMVDRHVGTAPKAILTNKVMAHVTA